MEVGATDYISDLCGRDERVFRVVEVLGGQPACVAEQQLIGQLPVDTHGHVGPVAHEACALLA